MALCGFISLYGFAVAWLGFLFADANYEYGVGCGLDLVCTVSHVYYTSHPFVIGVMGLFSTLAIIFIGISEFKQV